ncbi:hypothetical protein BDV98DRAFT_648716 [Pterulicium gracile]|uniref:RRM domain-containing protein n=1 Tax=Pterulicium gracile TaxID=1884261 RepID=A0A5C3QPF2_9AGAR|nr:hypothetical protein BDV98DRAFT_648716 [Pterula gracilis]
MSRVVFVGNVPYHMAEEQLIDVFKSVGQVVGLRLVFDRETGKAKGYGFCEFADHETAASAVRNLNGTDVGGRSLRIDLADSDPALEGKTTVRGEIVEDDYKRGERPHGRGDRDRDRYRDNKDNDRERGKNIAMNAFLSALPEGKPTPPGVNSLDLITQELMSLPEQQVMEVLAQTKAFIIKHPEESRALLVKQPQIAFALFQALLVYKIVDPSLLEKMSSAAGGPPPSQPPPPPHPASVPPPNAYPSYPSYPNAMPPQGYMMPPGMMPGAAPTPPPPAGMYGHPPPGQMYAGYGQPPPGPMVPPQSASPPVAVAGATEDHQRALAHVLRMTQDEVNRLPENERAMVETLRRAVGA